MPKPISLDLRTRVLADRARGLSFAELGRKYTLSSEWVRRFIRRHEATGEVAARPQVVKKQPFHKRHEADLRAAVAANRDLSLHRLRAQLKLTCSISTLHKALRALKLSFKKKRSRRPNATGPTSSPSGRSSVPSRPPGSPPTASSSSTRPGSSRT